ncbi:hypothetical protein Hanom_Chr07g00590731 [Helianthus anomalus]
MLAEFDTFCRTGYSCILLPLAGWWWWLLKKSNGSLNKLLIYPQILKETMSGLDWVVCKDGAAKEVTEQQVFLIYYELEICLESGLYILT